MLKLVGTIYKMFTGSVIGNIAGAVLTCFVGWIMGSWTKMFTKTLGERLVTAILPAA
jgi:hypothetical protein